MIKFKDLFKTLITEDLRSESDEYYYHITLSPYVDAIKKHGLKLKGTTPTVSNYKDYSKGKIFLCDIGVLDWWVHSIAAHAFHQFDDEQYHDVSVFKILKTKLKSVIVDKIGSDDSRGNSYYVTYDIPPTVLEFVKTEPSPY